MLRGTGIAVSTLVASTLGLLMAGHLGAAESAATPAVPEPPATAAPADAKALARQRREAMARGAEYLLKQQGADGSWAKGNVGITALCTDASLAAGKTLQDPRVRLAVEFLLKARKDDGGIYDDTGLRAYSTSIGLMALIKADPKGYAEPIKTAAQYLEKCQWGADESLEKTDLKYGGWGYGKTSRPDMSNSQFAADAYHALREAGVPEKAEVWARAVIFFSRSQDRSESNDKAFRGKDDGGGIYSPLVESKANTAELPDGTKVFRTYGSMTYALLKGFVFAGLKRDDPRLQAAMDWIRNHWTFDENPEMGQQGLYYFYQTAAKALQAWGEDRVIDGRRRTHDWRAELSEAILKRQRPDGSWVNKAERWYEGEQMAIVPTSYCLVALDACR